MVISSDDNDSSMGAIPMTVVISDSDNEGMESMGGTHPSTPVPLSKENSDTGDESSGTEDQRDQLDQSSLQDITRPRLYTAADFSQFQEEWLEE